jgi:hypothetical protein
VKFSVVAAAQGHAELVTHFPSKRAQLREANMVGIGWRAAAYQASLLRYES